MPHIPHMPRDSRPTTSPITPTELKPVRTAPQVARGEKPSPPAPEPVLEGPYHDRREMPIVPVYSMSSYSPSVDEIVSLMVGNC